MSTTRTVRGGTSLYGIVGDVGPDWGWITPRSGDALRISIPPGMAGRLRARVGLAAGLEGLATWDISSGDASSWTMVAFEATRLTSYAPESTSLIETFDALREASGGRWDGVDVEAYMREIRGD